MVGTWLGKQCHPVPSIMRLSDLLSSFMSILTSRAKTHKQCALLANERLKSTYIPTMMTMAVFGTRHVGVTLFWVWTVELCVLVTVLVFVPMTVTVRDLVQWWTSGHGTCKGNRTVSKQVAGTHCSIALRSFEGLVVRAASGSLAGSTCGTVLPSQKMLL